MDHHTLLTEPRPLNAAMQKVVQQLGGLGQLPDASPPFASLPPSRSRQVDVVVVGAGPAGLAAATAIAEASRDPTCSVLLVEAGLELGGSYLTDPRFGPAAAAAAEARARTAGVELHVATAAFGYYAEEQLLAVATPDGILKLRAPRYLYATGGHEQNLLFVDNDRPGVLPARAVGRIHTHYGLAVGERPLIVGDSDYASALAAALTDSGAQVRTIDGRRQRLHAARGRGWVSGAVIVDERGGEQQLDCDLIAIATPPAPAFELGKLHGAAIRFDDQRGFVLDVDDHGRTSAERLWACGEVTGQTGVAAALAHGQRVGAAIAAERG
jgi:sarcosine oxidase subunit alpha